MKISGNSTPPQVSPKSSQKTSYSSPVRGGMGYLLWIKILIYILLQSLQRCMQYYAILDHVIMALDCIGHTLTQKWFFSRKTTANYECFEQHTNWSKIIWYSNQCHCTLLTCLQCGLHAHCQGFNCIVCILYMTMSRLQLYGLYYLYDKVKASNFWFVFFIWQRTLLIYIIIIYSCLEQNFITLAWISAMMFVNDDCFNISKV